MSITEQKGLSDFGAFPAAIATFAVLLLSTLIFFLYRKFTSKPNTILIVGLNDAGKTLIFSKLINSENKWQSYTSMTENIYRSYLTNDGSCYTLVDVPGAESLRKILLNKWLVNERKNVKSIIFVVDSSTFGETSKDVADLIYEIYYESAKSIPVLVACNKQDNQLKAKSSKIIEAELEKEFGLITISRAASLSSTSGDSTKRLLTKSGAEFRWDEFKKRRVSGKPLISFVQCSAIEDDKADNLTLNAIREWVDSA